VRPTEDPDPVACLPAQRHRHHVVELEEAGLLAPPPVGRHERTLHSIAGHRLAPRRPRHRSLPPRLLRLPRRVGLAELSFLDLVEQRVQRAIEHLGQISRWHPVA